MANKIDPKYKEKLSPFDMDRATTKDVVALIKRYQNEDYGEKMKRRILNSWTYIFSLYSNHSPNTLFRGMQFPANKEAEYLKLLKKVISTNRIITKSIRSWTSDPYIAEHFAYALPDGPVNSRFSIVLMCNIAPAEAAILPDFAHLNESEHLLPPGTFSVALHSAAIYSKDYESALVYGYINKDSKEDLQFKMYNAHKAKSEAALEAVVSKSVFLRRLEDYL